jgi:hypothetical protein
MWEARKRGRKIAAILSVVESCRRLKLPVRGYLAAVLPGLADRPIQGLPDLTPAAWVTQPYDCGAEQTSRTQQERHHTGEDAVRRA